MKKGKPKNLKSNNLRNIKTVIIDKTKKEQPKLRSTVNPYEGTCYQGILDDTKTNHPDNPDAFNKEKIDKELRRLLKIHHPYNFDNHYRKYQKVMKVKSNELDNDIDIALLSNICFIICNKLSNNLIPRLKFIKIPDMFINKHDKFSVYMHPALEKLVLLLLNEYHPNYTQEMYATYIHLASMLTVGHPEEEYEYFVKQQEILFSHIYDEFKEFGLLDMMNGIPPE